MAFVQVTRHKFSQKTMYIRSNTLQWRKTRKKDGIKMIIKKKTVFYNYKNSNKY